MQPITLTIGIPAYNEQNNIARLLNSLLSQKQIGFVIEKIIVVTDGSTDDTNAKVESVADPRIVLVTSVERQGQNQAQQKIFTMAESDAVVLMEADTVPASVDYLAKLTSYLLEENRIGLVQGNPQLLPPTTLVGKIIDDQKQSYAKYSFGHLDPENVCSGRGGRLFAKSVYQNLIWPESVPEDCYALLWCREHQIPTKFAEPARTFYQPPQSLQELINERTKVLLGQKALKAYFPEAQVSKLYNDMNSIQKTLGLKRLLLMSADLFFRSPISFFGYLILKPCFSWLVNDQGNFNPRWQMNPTTKLLWKNREHE